MEGTFVDEHITLRRTSACLPGRPAAGPPLLEPARRSPLRTPAPSARTCSVPPSRDCRRAGEMRLRDCDPRLDPRLGQSTIFTEGMRFVISYSGTKFPGCSSMKEAFSVLFLPVLWGFCLDTLGLEVRALRSGGGSHRQSRGDRLSLESWWGLTETTALGQQRSVV